MASAGDGAVGTPKASSAAAQFSGSNRSDAKMPTCWASESTEKLFFPAILAFLYAFPTYTGFSAVSRSVWRDGSSCNAWLSRSMVAQGAASLRGFGAAAADSARDGDSDPNHAVETRESPAVCSQVDARRSRRLCGSGIKRPCCDFHRQRRQRVAAGGHPLGGQSHFDSYGRCAGIAQRRDCGIHFVI